MGPVQQEAFDSVIATLLQNGTLAHFDGASPVALKTDACKTGIAAFLLQQHELGRRIVCCCSRRLSQSECNYSVTELDAVAIVWSVSKLHHYLLGRKFRIVTDHCALCAVFKRTSTGASLNRWRLAPQEYDHDVIYTKGTMHSDVDCLSRAPLPDENDNWLEEQILAIYKRNLTTAAVTKTLVTPLNREEWV